MTCRICGCTDDRACPGGCSWVEPNLCSRCAEKAVPVFDETIGGALIDAARIAVMAASKAFPDVGPSVLLPGDENLPPTIHDCLGQAWQWLDAARAISIEITPEAMTSLHVVGAVRKP